jgi:hypothetical protein
MQIENRSNPSLSEHPVIQTHYNAGSHSHKKPSTPGPAKFDVEFENRKPMSEHYDFSAS